MKKVFLSILTLLYISASLGVTLHSNFCREVSVNGKDNQCKSKPCNSCHSRNISKEINNCCRHENKFVKNDKDQNIPEPVFQLPYLTGVALIPFAELSFNRLASATDVNLVIHAPPPNNGIAIYLRDRVFRI